MRPATFDTRITRLLGIRHPILCGGLGPKVSDARYVAAIVNAGGMGFIVAAGFPDPDEFREQLRLCRSLVGDQGFGVNLYISRQAGGVDRVRRQIDILIEEGVSCVETAGVSPEAVMPALKEAGIKVLHKVPAVRYAHTAARMGAVAVIIVGNECGGHPGVYQIGTMVQAAQAPGEIAVPVVIGGGIGTGRQLAAVLAMGGEAVIMGTRMMVSDELWVHPEYKARVAAGDGTESVVVKTAIRDHHRVLRNASAEAVMALDRHGVTDFDRFRPHVVGALAHEAYTTGDTSKGMLDYGHAAVFADKVMPVEAIFDEMIDDAVRAMRRVEALRLTPA